MDVTKKNYKYKRVTLLVPPGGNDVSTELLKPVS
jgi:hypothetical protein